MEDAARTISVGCARPLSRSSAPGQDGQSVSCPEDGLSAPKGASRSRIKIYVSYHSDTVRIANGILTPIHVGKALARTDLGMLGDDTGDNISDKNPMFAELTAQYWAWKNDRQSAYVGCMHYRRVFIFNGTHGQDVTRDKDRVLVPSVRPSSYADFGWHEADIVKAMEDCDVLLPIPCDVTADSKRDCRENFALVHGDENYQVFRRLLETYCPEYRDEADALFSGHCMYLCNMFVMRRDLFDHYCQWLFRVLDRFMPHLTPDAYDGSEIRMPAYMAERLFNLYVANLRRENPELRVKEVPYVLLQNTSPSPRPLPALKAGKPVVTIVTAFDTNYSPYFATMLASILDHVSEDRVYDIIVLEDAVPESDKQLYAVMTQGRPNVGIRYINMAGTFQEEGVTCAHITKSTFNRLKLPELLPEHSKVVYIDVDTVVLRDLAGLFDTDVSGYYAGVALDYPFKQFVKTGTPVSPNFGGTPPLVYLREYLEVDDGVIQGYFNAGVMVLNLDRIRADGLGEVFERLFHAKPYQWVDQDILNKAFGGKTVHVDPRWDVIPWPMSEMSKLPFRHLKEYEAARKNPFVLHFAGVKPWNNPRVDFSEYFWMYCRKTPYYEKTLTNALAVQRLLHDNGHPGTPWILASSPHALGRWMRLHRMKSTLSARLRHSSPTLWGFSRNVYVNVFRPVMRRLIWQRRSGKRAA